MVLELIGGGVCLIIMWLAVVNTWKCSEMTGVKIVGVLLLIAFVSAIVASFLV